MSQWDTVQFEQLLVDNKISYGVVQPGAFQTNAGTPLIRVNNIKNGKIDVSGIVRIHDDIAQKHSKTRLNGGELLITVVGAVGECAIVPKDLSGYNVARAVSVAKIKDIFDKRFIAYQFKTEDIKFQMYGNTNDTVQPTLNLSELKKLIFRLPKLSEQKAIASVLSSLDDKIDLLHRQNKTLESMAETMFRQWFVVGFDNNTTHSNLEQIINIQSGYAFKSKDFNNTGVYRVIKIKNISGNVVDIKETDFLNTEVGESLSERFHLKTGQALIAMTGAEIGKLGLIPKNKEKLVLNQRVGLLKPQFYGAEYLAYLYLNSEIGQDYIQNAATGSAQPNISASQIEACPFPEINIESLKYHANEIKIYFDKIVYNLGNIETLEKIRDTLLPKLMSGEVRVQDAEEAIASVA